MDQHNRYTDDALDTRGSRVLYHTSLSLSKDKLETDLLNPGLQSSSSLRSALQDWVDKDPHARLLSGRRSNPHHRQSGPVDRGVSARVDLKLTG